MKPSYRHGMALRLLAFLALSSGCLAQQPAWSEPRPLPNVPPNQLIRWPALATDGDTTFVVANLFPTVGDSVSRRPIYLASIPGGVIEAPAGDYQFAYPKLIRASGQLHLVWAEFDSTRRRVSQWGPFFPSSLFHAVWVRGRWSVPERVFQATTLQWTRDGGDLAVDADGRLHVVVWYGQVGELVGVMHLRQDGTGWRKQRLPVVTALTETAISIQGRTATVAIVMNPAMGNDTRGVMLLRSEDAGDTWGSPSTIRTLGARDARNAMHPQFVRAATELSLVWTEAPAGRFSHDSLLLVRVGPDLRASARTSVALPDGANWYSVASAACGDVSALVGIFSLNPTTFEVALDGNTSSVRSLLADTTQLATVAGIGAGARQFTAVLATRPIPGTPARAVVMTRPAC